METLTMFTGNDKRIEKDLPEIIILGFINDGALQHIAENTCLIFEKTSGGYKATPKSSNQIVRLFLTYNFKTRYFDNWQYKNTIVLKDDHHIGFEVDKICSECVKANNIHSNIGAGHYLAC